MIYFNLSSYTDLNTIILLFTIKQINENMERIKDEKQKVESELHDLLNQQEELSKSYSEVQENIKILQETVLTTKIHGETCIKVLLESIIGVTKQNYNKFVTDSEEPNGIEPKLYFFVSSNELKHIMTKLKIAYEQYGNNNDQVDILARVIIRFGHFATSFHHQGLLICNKMPDIEIGDRMFNVYFNNNL